MKYNNLKRYLVTLAVFFMGNTITAQTTAAKPSAGGVDMNWVLLFVALLLTIPVYILSRTFIFILKEKMRKEKEDNGSKGMLTILFIFFSLSTFAQDVVAKPKQSGYDIFSAFSNTTWLLIIAILLELIVILFLSFKTVSFIRPAKESIAASPEMAIAKPGKLKTWFSKRWEKWNNFRPIEQEADIDTGHSYDGIRELDNPAPIWFKVAFGLTILFGLVYLYRYHIAKSAPLQAEEYAIAVREGEAEHQLYLKTQADVIDENNVKMLDGEAIASGKMIFKEKCAACHLESGAGSTGPNLTDDYWIHGGSMSSIFKTIKYGWVEKGMQSWKEFLSAKQIAQLTSFIKSIKGTNPPNAKPPQGDLYKEETTVVSSTATPAPVDASTPAVSAAGKTTQPKDTLKK